MLGLLAPLLTLFGIETDRAVEALTARERALLDVLGPAEHDRLDRTLDKLVAHLDARAGATAP